MTLPRHKSGRFRRVYKKTPGGKVVLSFRDRKAGKPQCKMCGEYLKGVARGRTSEISKYSKSHRRPERPFGGVLCTKCMRKVMIDKAKALVMKDG